MDLVKYYKIQTRYEEGIHSEKTKSIAFQEDIKIYIYI